MAKAGLGKGNAFTAPGPSYPNIELERRAARERERAHSLKEKAMIGKYAEEEASVKAIIDEFISDKRVRDRVKKDIGIGLTRARRGHDPLGGKLSCDGCARPGHESHHFLCLNKAKFKTRAESSAYDAFVVAIRKYSDLRRREIEADQA